MTHLRQMMLDELQGRKSLRLCLVWLRVRWFDPIAEVSELPDHLPSAQLLRSLGNGWAAFLVTNSLVQDQPDQSTLSMCNGSDGLYCVPGAGPSGDTRSRIGFLWSGLQHSQLD